MTYYAHSLRNAPRERWHPLAEHLGATGHRAAGIAAKWGAEAWGHAAGRLHDVGKYAPKFLQRLQGGTPVDHATASGAELKTPRSTRLVGADSIVAPGPSGRHPTCQGLRLAEWSRMAIRNFSSTLRSPAVLPRRI
jgi:hypothetical protein